jgi:hypothetical protein
MIHDNSRESHRHNEESGKGATCRKLVIAILQAADGPMTDREILNSSDEFYDVNSVRPQITRLIKDGIVEECGKTTCPDTGRTVRLNRLRPPAIMDFKNKNQRLLFK